MFKVHGRFGLQILQDRGPSGRSKPQSLGLQDFQLLGQDGASEKTMTK